MSGDMMQTLSGSSLLSLSFGTLPAVKAGMNLDANPFASQLALMTGPEAAIGGSAVPVAAGDVGEFALALADMADAPVAAGSGEGIAVTADLALPAPVRAEGAAPRIVQLPTADVVTALPADATPSQIIEAVMQGAASAPSAAPAPRPVSGALIPSVTAATLDDVPADQAQPAPRVAVTPATPSAPPVAAIKAPADGPADVIVQPETLVAADSEHAPAEPASTHPRRAAKVSAPDGAVAEPVIIAPAITPVTTPVASAPDAPAPDTGTTRVAVSAAPAPAPVSASVGEDIPEATANNRAAVDPATFVAPTAAPQAPQPARTAIAPAIDATAPAQVSQPTEARAEPVQLAAVAPSPVAAAPTAAAPATDAPKPVAAAAAAPAIPAPATAAPVVPASAAASAAPQPARPAAPAVRVSAGTGAQRAVQAAVQSPQPAQALAALFNLGDASEGPLPTEAMTETALKPRIEAVQPSWVAALNAVTAPVNSPAMQALTAPAATAAPQAPLETLAFDAAFIGNIETQISRVMGGGQMVRMQIMPEHLGRIDIEMLAGPDRDSVRLVTEHDAVRDTLVQSQVRLEQDLRQNGQRGAEVTVELRQQSPGTQGGSAQQQRGQAGPEGSAQRDAGQRQNAGTAADTQTPAQRRPRGNVRYA